MEIICIQLTFSTKWECEKMKYVFIVKKYRPNDYGIQILDVDKIFSNIDSAHAYVMMQPGIDCEEQTGFYTGGNIRYYNGYRIETCKVED